MNRKSGISRTMLLQKINKLEYKASKSMAANLAKVEGIYVQLESAGVEMQEEKVVTFILGRHQDTLGFQIA